MTYPVPPTTPGADPFADPAAVPSTYPSTESLRGRLVMIVVRKIEQVPNRQNPQVMNDRITADVTVVDGRGPVPVFKNYQHTGQFLEGPSFPGMYISGSRLVTQLTPYIGTNQPVLGVIDTYQPGQRQGQGNPWGLTAATPEQRAIAVNFLNTRSVAGAAAPAPAPVQQAAPVAPQAPAPAQQPAYYNPFGQVEGNPYGNAAPAAQPASPQAAPAPAAPVAAAPVQANPFGQQPAPAAPSAAAPNPFGVQQPAPAAPNPFGQPSA